MPMKINKEKLKDYFQALANLSDNICLKIFKQKICRRKKCD